MTQTTLSTDQSPLVPNARIRLLRDQVIDFSDQALGRVMEAGIYDAEFGELFVRAELPGTGMVEIPIKQVFFLKWLDATPKIE